MQLNLKTVLTATALASAVMLAACGGGGDAGNSSAGETGAAAIGGSSTVNTGSAQQSSPATSTTPGTQTSPQYPADSAELAAFNLINQLRTQCGFPAYQESTSLDQAAQAHATYMSLNGVISDSETSGNPAFTGVSYLDRATAAGFSNGDVGGVSSGYYTTSKLSRTQYGQQHVLSLLGGVYHIGAAAWPVSMLGIGVSETTFNGYPDVRATLSLAGFKVMPGNMPLTLPCEGTMGVAAQSFGEKPSPPSTSGPWGTPIAVVGNATDTVVLLTGSMTDKAGHTIALKLLSSTTDPNRLLSPFEAVAYPTTALQPNTRYTVVLTGTINGAEFSRSFSFTTGG